MKTEDFEPTLIPFTDELDLAVPMSLRAMQNLRNRFKQDTKTILEWHEWITNTYEFEFDFAFLCVSMGSLRSYLESGLTKEDWRRDHKKSDDLDPPLSQII